MYRKKWRGEERIMKDEEYIILEKSKKEFQMVLNQWKHGYHFEILWMDHDPEYNCYMALVKRCVK